MDNTSAGKINKIPLYKNIPSSYKKELNELIFTQNFSFQQLKQLCEFSLDLYSWDCVSLLQLLKGFNSPEKKNKQSANLAFNHIKKNYNNIKEGSKSYNNDISPNIQKIEVIEDTIEPKGSIIGRCPVASEKTRCCNLKTLDAVWRCGFDCSYCSIQSFYHDNKVKFVENLREKLDCLEFDKNKLYHIGTGQSSDSLMWGNKNGLLDDLVDFAYKHPNVILEMKSKSSNISWFKNNPIPKNMVFTWSLNPQVVIEAEEKKTASLDKRIEAARYMSDKKSPVGFHFHPIIMYDNWKNDYADIVNKLTKNFKPSEIMMISMGTLTFIKPVIKKIRSRAFKTKILQMPMEEIAGKLSYPYNLKKEMFTYFYNLFPKEWKESIFFYFCMEDIRLWDFVLERSYSSNELFEQDMIKSYFSFNK